MPDISIDERRLRESFEQALRMPRFADAPYCREWMSKIRFSGLGEDGKMILTVCDLFTRDFISDHFIHDLLVLMENDLQSKVEVEWRVDPDAGHRQVAGASNSAIPTPFKATVQMPGESSEVEVDSIPRGQVSDGPSNAPMGGQEFTPSDIITPLPPPPTVHPVSYKQIFNRLDDRFRFDSFVSAPSNQLAVAGARALVEAPASAYNPLFIYGGSGLGKTHLLNAIGHRFLELHPGARVIYMSSDDLTNDFIGSFQNNRMPEFRKRMREDCDCLLIDDIQFLGKREQTQEEFFNIFNALYNAGKPVAMTSDRIPAEIEGIADRLRTRFVSGLLADIQEPDFETRVAILKKKAEIFHIQLPDNVAWYIAKVVQSNVRELQMALNRVYAHHSLTKVPMTEELAAHILKNVLPEPKQLGVEDVQKEISKYYNVTVESLSSPKRQKNIVKARQMAMYISRKLTGISYPELGERFHRDHSTVMASCEKIETELMEDESLKQELEDLMTRLGKGRERA